MINDAWIWNYYIVHAFVWEGQSNNILACVLKEFEMHSTGQEEG